MWTVIGIVLFALALLFSIAWHELGHLTFAKLFKVRTTQYMVGFGKTVWSRHVGETEYGIKAIPLGGYIRMIGMVPPERPRRGKWRSAPSTTAMGAAGMVRNIIDETRASDRTQVTEADEGRQFYQLHPFKRIVIMFAGPFMNLILAVGIFAVLLVGIGVPTPSTTVSDRQRLRDPGGGGGRRAADRVPAGRPGDPGRPRRPAARRPDRRFDGTPITGWDQLTDLIRASAGTTVQLDVRARRAGS